MKSALAACSKLSPVVTAVAYPCEASALTATIEAAQAGARVPVVLTRRADSVRARLPSAAVAVRLAHARRART